MATSKSSGDLLLKDYLHRFQGEKLIKNYFVLWGHTDQAYGRLEWYESEQQYERSLLDSTKRKVIYMEDVASVDLEASASSHIVLTPKSTVTIQPLIIKCGKPHVASMWLESLRAELSVSREVKIVSRPPTLHFMGIKLSKRGVKFDVICAETSQADRCGMTGEAFKLHIQHRGLFLQQPNGAVVNHWPLQTLRKFGDTDSVFTIEAGRLAPTGEGIWHFYTDNPARVVSEVRKAVEAVKDKMNEESSDDYETLVSDGEEDKHDYMFDFKSP